MIFDLVEDHGQVISEDVRFGECLGVDTALLVAAEKRLESEDSCLEDVIYCSEEAVRGGECPDCNYKALYYFGEATDYLVIDRMCDIHKQIFNDEPPSRLKALALKRLT